MLAARIIPCLDIDKGRVVKGVRFVDLADAGDPIASAKEYNNQGADELIVLDISASNENRSTTLEIIERIASQVFIPLTVGGGVRSLADIHQLLRSGADKVSINTAAVDNPQLVSKASRVYGSQCIVVAIDAKRHQDSWQVVTHGGRRETGLDAIQWARKMEQHGAGEILLTSMDADGGKNGFDIALTRAVTNAISIPLIASGGVGTLQHLVDGIVQGKAQAVLAASIFHYRQHSIRQAKECMRHAGIAVRL